MAALEADVFTSKQFLFIVGENHRAFSVHAAVIAKQSRALDVLINGSMAEAVDGKASFKDILPVTEDVFGWGTKPKKSTKPSKRRLLRQSFDDRRYDIETMRALAQVRYNSSASEDYTPVLLGHAKLYVFAEKWNIKALKALSLHKLHKTLVSFTLYGARRPDIVELLRYAYSNEHTPDCVDIVDDLRSLVMLYTACEVESLVKCAEFLSLIGDGGQLAQELVQMLMQRIA